MRKNLLIFRTAEGENEWSCKKVISPYLLLFMWKPVAFLFSRAIAQGCQAWVGTQWGWELRSCQSQVGTTYLPCLNHLYSQPFFIKCLHVLVSALGTRRSTPKHRPPLSQIFLVSGADREWTTCTRVLVFVRKGRGHGVCHSYVPWESESRLPRGGDVLRLI